MQERCNSSANALELHLSCTNPSILSSKNSTANCFVALAWCHETPPCQVSIGDHAARLSPSLGILLPLEAHDMLIISMIDLIPHITWLYWGPCSNGSLQPAKVVSRSTALTLPLSPGVEGMFDMCQGLTFALSTLLVWWPLPSSGMAMVRKWDREEVD